MSSKAVASLNNNKDSAPTKVSGAGPSGAVAVATVKPVAGTGIVDQVTTTQVVRSGTGTTPPATAANFDRTVATSLGK
jgi:hypothetical protein